MNKILIVEDSDVVTKVLRHVVQASASFHAVYAASLAQAEALYAEHEGQFFAALVDLNLPDAPNGEVVDFTLKHKIPTVVLTGSYDEQRRETLFAKGIVDYVTKEGRYAYQNAVQMLHRLEKNQRVKVLVVDDSDMSRRHVVNLLKRHLFQIVEAADGVDAIKVLLDNPDIKLLITDYNMPRMDGFELVRNLRYKYDKTGLVMIGISGESSEALSAKFIKHGANDFLRKPFQPEEFYCRVLHNVESLELMEQVAYAAQRDQLTGLYHRHHFFNLARDLYRTTSARGTALAAAILNVDGLGYINEKYGSEWGDHALGCIAQHLEKMLQKFLLCRADGDDFYVLLSGLDNEKAVALIGEVRRLIAAEAIMLDNEPVYLSLSAGVTSQRGQSIDEQLAHAKRLLQLAKEAGGNMTVDDENQ
jgi:diguanylate cyclase (GGDEF)-like protein